MSDRLAELEVRAATPEFTEEDLVEASFYDELSLGGTWGDADGQRDPMQVAVAALEALCSAPLGTAQSRRLAAHALALLLPQEKKP